MWRPIDQRVQSVNEWGESFGCGTLSPFCVVVFFMWHYLLVYLFSPVVLAPWAWTWPLCPHWSGLCSRIWIGCVIWPKCSKCRQTSYYSYVLNGGDNCFCPLWASSLRCMIPFSRSCIHKLLGKISSLFSLQICTMVWMLYICSKIHGSCMYCFILATDPTGVEHNAQIILHDCLRALWSPHCQICFLSCESCQVVLTDFGLAPDFLSWRLSCRHVLRLFPRIGH